MKRLLVLASLFGAVGLAVAAAAGGPTYPGLTLQAGPLETAINIKNAGASICFADGTDCIYDVNGTLNLGASNSASSYATTGTFTSDGGSVNGSWTVTGTTTSGQYISSGTVQADAGVFAGNLTALGTTRLTNVLADAGTFSGSVSLSGIINGKRLGQLVMTGPTSAAFTAYGISTHSGTGLATSTGVDTTRSLISATTGATTGNTATFAIGANVSDSKWSMLPRACWVIRTDAMAHNERIYIGLGDVDPTAYASTAAANGANAIMFRCDQGLSDTNWMGLTANGTTATAASTGVSCAASTTSTFCVEQFLSGTANFIINGAVVLSTTTTVPTSTGAAIGLTATLTTLTDNASVFYASRAMLEQN